MRVLYVGDRDALDFLPARRRLAAAAERGVCDVCEESDISSAHTTLTRWLDDDSETPPDLVLLGQLRPGEFSERDIDLLRQSAPLAAIVVLLGNWCEGEGRSGRSLPGVVRVPWHRFGAQWHRYLGCSQRRRCSPWELPATATEEERMLWVNRLRAADDGTNSMVRVVLGSHGRVGDDWLAAICRAQGWQVARCAREGDITDDAPCVGLWQTDALDAADLRHLTRFARRLGSTPVLVILGFPRPEDNARIRAAGATSFLAKPLAIDELAVEVDWLLSACGAVTH